MFYQRALSREKPSLRQNPFHQEAKGGNVVDHYSVERARISCCNGETCLVLGRLGRMVANSMALLLVKALLFRGIRLPLTLF